MPSPNAYRDGRPPSWSSAGVVTREPGARRLGATARSVSRHGPPGRRAAPPALERMLRAPRVRPADRPILAVLVGAVGVETTTSSTPRSTGWPPRAHGPARGEPAPADLRSLARGVRAAWRRCRSPSAADRRFTRRVAGRSVATSAGTSSVGLRSKKPCGLSTNPQLSTGMTGQSSGRGKCVTPKVCHMTTSPPRVAVRRRTPAARRRRGAGWAVAGRIALGGVVRRHPQVPGRERRPPGDRRAGSASTTG